MRLLCLTPMAPEPAAPSFGSFVVSLVEALRAEAGIEIDLLARRPGWRGPGSYLELLARGGLRPGVGIELVWAHYLGPATGVGWALGRRLGVPLVLTAHGSDLETRGSRGGELLLGSLVRRAAGLHLVSRHLEEVARARFGPRRGLTLVQPLGVDLSRFVPRPRARTGARRRLLMVASLTPYKGWEEALGALGRLEDLDLELVGIGAGDPAWVQQRARAHGVAHRLTLLSTRAHAQMPGLYATADILLAPSWREGLGLAGLEAMACGVPVVTSGVGGMAEYVIDGVNARVSPPRDPVRLAATLREVLGHGALRRTLVAGGLGTAPRFELRAAAQALVGFFAAAARRA